MRFYVPEWDDAVDGEFDFLHDEHSELDRSVRPLQYIWDIFDYETTPIDGVLISREKVEESTTKFERFQEHGVYDDPVLDIPEWLPTISDCGAWGYKNLPFPPYEAEEMLDFYTWMDVNIGVTIDHLVLGSGKQERLYLNSRALGENLSVSDLPKGLKERVDIMAQEWPGEEQKWPEYVKDEEPSIYHAGPVNQFELSDFEGKPQNVLTRLKDDPRAVYRSNDTRYRYNLTLRNAEKMKQLYDAGDYPFRLMVAVQGWDPTTYARATERVLEMGYGYLGIGGVASSPGQDVEEIVSEVGSVVKNHERVNGTRVESHVFGFAKTDLFESVGRAGMTSFDSASMLRSAWEGGNNYHINGKQYAALRVRFGGARDDLDVAIEKALRGQELLYSLRAYDQGKKISEAIEEWYSIAQETLNGLLDYIESVRHQGVYEDFDRLRDTKEYFRDDYEFGRALSANFSRKFRTRILKLLRDDTAENSTSYHEYLELVNTAQGILESNFPNAIDAVRQIEAKEDEIATTRQILSVVEDYTHSDVIGDEGHFEDYKTLLGDRPWDDCDCCICEEYSIEVAIFRGNNRNRRRGFHNTRKFYEQFNQELPKVLVAAPTSVDETTNETLEEILSQQWPNFWREVHDIPVVEVGGLTDERFFEWWERPEKTLVSGTDLDLSQQLLRYRTAYVYAPDDQIPTGVRDKFDNVDCELVVVDSPKAVREQVLDRLGYPAGFLPNPHTQSDIAEW